MTSNLANFIKMQSQKVVIPVKTGIQFYMFLVPCFRWDDVWIPAGVYPALDTGRE